jgi:hypothetical protein
MNLRHKTANIRSKNALMARYKEASQFTMAKGYSPTDRQEQVMCQIIFAIKIITMHKFL